MATLHEAMLTDFAENLPVRGGNGDKHNRFRQKSFDYGDGTKGRKLFFLSDGHGDTDALHIGSSDYTIPD